MISKHFKIQELVDRVTYEARGEKAWELINPGLIETIDKIKETFPEGTMTINNWEWRGDRQWSGLRTPRSMYYSTYSQHSLGNAIDAVFSHYDVNEVRNYILDNPDEFPNVGGVELDVSWLHVDCRNFEGIKTFYA